MATEPTPEAFQAAIKNVNTWVNDEDTFDLSVAYSDLFLRSGLPLVDISEIRLLADYSESRDQLQQYRALLDPHYALLPNKAS